MSTNIHFEARRKIQIELTGKIEEQTEHFKGVWQTPTSVTWKIIGNIDPILAYKTWILSVTEDHEINIYNEDDIWHDQDPVSTRIYNAGEDHCKEFDEWIKNVTDRGFDITAEAW